MSKLKSTHFASLCALAAVALAGCEKKPGGQVVAVVDGQEITQQDVKAQAVSQNITDKDALDKATPAIVQQLVDRTVLAQYGQDQKIDRNPEYIARRRQMDESLLSYMALRKLIGKIDPPSAAEAQKYIAANPLMFANRQRLTLDQIRFPAPTDPKEITRLTQSNNLDAVVARLKANGINYSRSAAFFDTGTVDPRLATQIARLPDGEIFNLTLNGQSFVSQIKSRQPVPGDRAAWPNQASQMIQKSALDKAVKAKLDQLKAKSKISYDAAYAPAAAKQN